MLRQTMSEIQSIQSALETAARRRRTQRALRGLWIGLLIGGSAILAATITFKVLPVSTSVVWWSLLAALGCALFGFLIGGWRKPGLAETARWVDVKQHLKERMSTALEFSADDQSGTWRELVMHDAASHAQESDARKLVPFRLPKLTRWALLVLALAAGLGFVPEYRSKAFVQKQADAKVIKEVGKQVADLTRKQIQQRPPALETTKKSLESVTDMGEKLQKASLTRSEALKNLANASDKLKDQLKDLSKDPALKKMEQAARQPGGNDAKTADGLQKQIESLQKQLANANASPEAIDKLQKDLDRLKEAAKGLADKSGAEADAEKQKVAAMLSQLSKDAAHAG